MNRRTLLRNGLAVGNLLAFSGCTERSLKDAESQPELFDTLYDEEELDLPVEQQFERVEAGVHHTEGRTIETSEEFVALLEEYTLQVETISETVDTGDIVLSLDYLVADLERGRAVEVGIIAGVYASFVEGGYDGDHLEATLLDPQLRTFGEFTVLTSWAEQYNTGEMTAATYGKQSLKELESTHL